MNQSEGGDEEGETFILLDTGGTFSASFPHANTPSIRDSSLSLPWMASPSSCGFKKKQSENIIRSPRCGEEYACA